MCRIKDKKNLPIYYTAYSLPNDFPLLTLSAPNQNVQNATPSSLHFHSCIEVGQCLSGNGKIYLQEKCCSCQAGDFILLSSGIPHAYTSLGEVCRWESLLFDPSLIPEARDSSGISLPGRLPVGQPDPIIRQTKLPFLHFLLQQTFEEIHCKKPLYREKIHGLLLAALIEFDRLLPPSTDGSSCGNQTSAVMNALSFMQAHYHEPVNIAQIASANHLSESHFRRIFKTMIGVSPLEYLQHYRIQQACRYLLEGKQNIHDIAALVGYSSISSFNRQFLQYMHVSPQDWKKIYFQKKSEEPPVK